jgi:hypothetical protein
LLFKTTRLASPVGRTHDPQRSVVESPGIGLCLALPSCPNTCMFIMWFSLCSGMPLPWRIGSAQPDTPRRRLVLRGQPCLPDQPEFAHCLICNDEECWMLEIVASVAALVSFCASRSTYTHAIILRLVRKPLASSQIPNERPKLPTPATQRTFSSCSQPILPIFRKRIIVQSAHDRICAQPRVQPASKRTHYPLLLLKVLPRAAPAFSMH